MLCICPASSTTYPAAPACNLTPATLAELAEHPNINAVKEASGNISQVAEIAALCGDELNLYSGNDDQIVPLLALGGKGVISVLSNVAPQYTHDICAKWFAGDFDESLAMQLKALPLIKALFADVNPIPVKWAMNRLGWQAGECRLPLVAPLRSRTGTAGKGSAGFRPAEIIRNRPSVRYGSAFMCFCERNGNNDGYHHSGHLRPHGARPAGENRCTGRLPCRRRCGPRAGASGRDPHLLRL